MFKTQNEQVSRDMERGKQKIIGNGSNKDELYRTKVIDLLKLMTPEEKRNLMNQDLAWLICDQTLSMIKNREVINELPLPLKKKIQEIINLESQLKLSEETRDDILEDVEESYIRQFKV